MDKVFATLRTFRERKHRGAVVELAKENQELQKKTDSLTDGEVPADEASGAPVSPRDGADAS